MRGRYKRTSEDQIKRENGCFAADRIVLYEPNGITRASVYYNRIRQKYWY